MAKRHADDSNEVRGYIHEISPIKLSRSNNPYFTGKIQVNTNTFQKIVCFDQSKHVDLMTASTGQTPIKLCDVRNVPSREDSTKIDILLNSKTAVNAVRSLNFRCHKDAESAVTSDKTVAEIELIPEKNHVNVVAKVLKVDCSTAVDVRGQLVNKQDIIVGDSTGTIRVTLWENMVDKVNRDSTYRFENLSTRMFNSLKFLTATRTSQVIDTTPLENVAALPPNEILSKVVGRVTQIAISKHVACGSCRKKLSINVTTDSIVRCGSCNMKQKVTDTISTLLCNIKVQDKKFTIFHPQLINFLIVIDKEDLKNDPDRLEDFFLGVDNIVVQYGHNNVVDSINIDTP